MAATCDPIPLISSELCSAIADPGVVFPEGQRVPFSNIAVGRDKKCEYVRLTIRELRCGKLRLRSVVQGSGGVFAGPKGGNKQRKIWDGSMMSRCAAEPPKPRRLANPSCFLDLEVPSGGALHFSKRDASTYFDCLQVPRSLQPWLTSNTRTSPR